MPMLLLLACVSAPPDPVPYASDPPPEDDTSATGDDTGHDSGHDTSQDSGLDTGGDTGKPVLLGYACPEGMAGIPSDSPTYCIDLYEATVGEAGALGVPGVVPTTGVTFEEAAALCEATPALDDLGEPYGYLRIATADEWEDAGDGVVGEGGSLYPWGDEYDDTRCATPLSDGTVLYEELQPTGSFPDCVSAFGVYDLVGNAWEWTDSGRVLDAATALDDLARAGIALEETDDGLRLASGSADAILLDAAGLQPPIVSADADGTLYVTASQVQPAPESWFARGYLMHADVRLAVSFTQVDTTDDSVWRLFVAREYDGRTLPDKRGCAYYTGTDYACSVQVPSYAHLPDFDGTIGFRCVAAPYPVYGYPSE